MQQNISCLEKMSPTIWQMVRRGLPHGEVSDTNIEQLQVQLDPILTHIEYRQEQITVLANILDKLKQCPYIAVNGSSSGWGKTTMNMLILQMTSKWAYGLLTEHDLPTLYICSDEKLTETYDLLKSTFASNEEFQFWRLTCGETGQYDDTVTSFKIFGEKIQHRESKATVVLVTTYDILRSQCNPEDALHDEKESEEAKCKWGLIVADDSEEITSIWAPDKLVETIRSFDYKAIVCCSSRMVDYDIRTWHNYLMLSPAEITNETEEVRWMDPQSFEERCKNSGDIETLLTIMEEVHKKILCRNQPRRVTSGGAKLSRIIRVKQVRFNDEYDYDDGSDD